MENPSFPTCDHQSLTLPSGLTIESTLVTPKRWTAQVRIELLIGVGTAVLESLEEAAAVHALLAIHDARIAAWEAERDEAEREAARANDEKIAEWRAACERAVDLGQPEPRAPKPVAARIPDHPEPRKQRVTVDSLRSTPKDGVPVDLVVQRSTNDDGIVAVTFLRGQLCSTPRLLIEGSAVSLQAKVSTALTREDLLELAAVMNGQLIVTSANAQVDLTEGLRSAAANVVDFCERHNATIEVVR